MKKRVYISLLCLAGYLLGTGLFAQTVTEIGIRALNLDPGCGDRYIRRVLDVVDFNLKFPQLYAAYPDSLPGKVVCFKPIDLPRLREEQFGCEDQALEFYREITKQSQETAPYPEDWWFRFNQLYKERHPSCFYFYRKLAPVLSIDMVSRLGAGARLDRVQVEVFARTVSQASGAFLRPADADLLIPATGLGLLDCLNKSREGYRSYQTPGHSFELRQLLWSETYYNTIPGRIPSQELLLLKLHFSFILEDSTQVFSTPIFILQL